MTQIVQKPDYKNYKTVSKKTLAKHEKFLNKENELLASIPWRETIKHYQAKLAPLTDTIKLRFDPVNDKIYKLSKVK